MQAIRNNPQTIVYKPYNSNPNYLQKSSNISFTGGSSMQTQKVGEAIGSALSNTAKDAINDFGLRTCTVPLFLNKNKMGKVSDKLLGLARIIRENPDIDKNKLAEILEQIASKMK